MPIAQRYTCYTNSVVCMNVVTKCNPDCSLKASFSVAQQHSSMSAQGDAFRSTHLLEVADAIFADAWAALT